MGGGGKGKGKAPLPGREKKKVGPLIWVRIPLRNSRTHAQTKRNETISRLDSPPTSDPVITHGMKKSILTKELIWLNAPVVAGENTPENKTDRMSGFRQTGPGE